MVINAILVTASNINYSQPRRPVRSVQKRTEIYQFNEILNLMHAHIE